MKYTACMTLSFFLIASTGICQQAAVAAPVSPGYDKFAKAPQEGIYTYTLFVAPNKLFGYNIFKNGRIIFHQPAMAEPANSQPSITKKMQAEKAAAMAIEKIRRGMPGELTNEELVQATAQ